MTTPDTNSWTGIRAELLRRIHARVWEPGAQIPHEADLAEEFGCARTTVNRALRDLAESGLVVRKRRAGTRVALNPPQRATLTIPIIREEVEALGKIYRHSLLERDFRPLPPMLHGAFQVTLGQDVLFLKTVHFADDRPFAFEERYINLEAAPDARDARFEDISANEWLVHNAPYSHGDLSFFAVNADERLSRKLDAAPGTALFSMERITWSGAVPITHVRLVYAPGYRMRTEI
ncbi:MAG: UTRA domain-containing protein [Roseibium sp.]|uniref:UTRA domain-containing protein n=1 Tax=Roseibium sp. TaxID=1936156 RepID=UPI001B208EE5|nr:UTRA domain-containing protein [Roseibium sp.]MBO6895461.1 UTRA domain-containing protein [Roseibium sp.]MBO6931552.1 UTRA domain-containing protein [Roseibium sp.]